MILGESVEKVMCKLMQQNLIKVNDHLNYQEPSFETPWYIDKYLCEFHKIKGHTTNNCMRLKHLIQDLTNKGEVDVEHQTMIKAMTKERNKITTMQNTRMGTHF